jgi:uncharacterized protein (TIGR00725 family)
MAKPAATVAKPASNRRLVIGVMGPASCDPLMGRVAEAVGRGIAQRGATLLCGGRGGVMEAAARGARSAGGLTVGVLPGKDAKESPPNEFIDVALFTGVGEARNWINVCSSDALIAVGGGFGTLSEIGLALKAGKPLVLLASWACSIDGAGPKLPLASDAEQAVEMAFAALSR